MTDKHCMYIHGNYERLTTQQFKPHHTVFQLTLSFSIDLHASARRLRLLSYTLSRTMEPGAAVAVKDMGSLGSADDWLKYVVT